MDADLHLHTSASDGKLTPQELVRLAGNVGLKAIAVTDHDTTAGLEEAIKEGEQTGVEVVPGIELSTEWGKTEVHVLGYYIDYQGGQVQEKLQHLREGRRRRGEMIISKLQALGYNIDFQRVLEIAGGGSLGRPHIAVALLEKGYVASVEDAFNRFIGRDTPGYVPRAKLSPVEAVEVILKADGIPVLAHPGLIHEDSIIQELAGVGLQGIEVYYPGHDKAATHHYQRLARAYKLIATGGSDFHGYPNEGPAYPGVAGVSYEVIEQLQAAKGEK
ncbi:MAG: PHP domain-containing protein [Bacillota bacterium]